MSDQMTADQKATREAQLEALRAWMAAARGSAYMPTDKRRFARLKLDGKAVTMPPGEAYDWISDAPDTTYELSEAWLTTEEFEQIPEFEGF